MSKKKKLRGAFVSALSLSMALSSMGAVSAQSVNDVKGHWAEQQIDSWIANGSLNGYQDGSVKPNSAITRAEFIVLVNRLFEFSETASADFKDLSPSNWAYNDVAKALKAGYVKGYSDNTFQPSSNVSRQEAASMISSVLGLDPSNSEGIKQFKDAGKIPAWSQGSIAAVIEKGIMKGYPDGTFQAQKQLTRAEAIVLIDSALNNRTVAKETLSIDTPGTYGSAQETKVVNGDVIINVAGVTLENYEIKGDLLLASGIGSGDVTIKNVKVHGTTNVEGGGENSIHFVDSVLVNVLVNKKYGTVRLVAEGTTTAQKVIVQSSAKLEENELKGEGFTDIELAKELPANARIQLNGKFDDVDVFSASVTVQLQRGSIQDVKVDATAANNTIQISAGAQVVNLVLNAISKILGASNITTVTLNSGSQNSAFDVRPSNVQGDQKGSIVVNTPSSTTTASSGESSSGGSSSGGSSGGSTGGLINQGKPTGLSSKEVTEVGHDGKITGVTSAMEYRLKGSANWTTVAGTEVTGLAAGTYEVRYAAKAGYNAGAAVEVVVEAYVAPELENQDAPTGLDSTAVTAAGNDGTITGVTDAMEYRLKDSNNAWTAVTGTEITELVAGTYEVRYAAKTGHNAGSVEEVTVAAYVAPDTTVTKMQENSDLNTGAVSFNWSSINGIGSKDKLENTNGSSYNYYSDGAYIALQLTDAEGNVLPFNDVLSEITLQTNNGTVDTIPDSNREKADFGIEGFEQYKTVLAQPIGGNSLFYGLRQSNGVAHTVGFEAGAKRTINLTVKAKESAVVGTYTITIFTAQQGTEFKSQGEALKYTVEVQAPNQDQKAPEGLNSTAVTATGNDGTITGVTDEMEYRLQGASDWTKVTAESTTITGLASGTYEVRYAAKTGYNAGSVEEVTVVAYVTE
ncbi:S-layer homology domain-containing protein [Paenibacillus sp. FSL R5-0517]|uniref:S-layer homology domain-containing protein n=1 Tax=Paenibacillus sp. FSL R5-0517 TaxID=2921647 RepID=UPI0030D83AAC